MMALSARTLRTTVAALGAVAALAAGASAASATTIRSGTTTSTGTTVVPSGTSIGGNLTGNASLTAAGTGGGTGTCTAGNLAGKTGTNPAATVALTPTAFNLKTCTDTIPAFNIVSAALQTPGTGSVKYNGTTAPQGTLSVINPVIKVNITAGGAPGACTIVINNATSTAAGALTNPTTATSLNGNVNFVNVPVKTTTAGICATAINGGAGSKFTAKFQPLRRLDTNALLSIAA